MDATTATAALAGLDGPAALVAQMLCRYLPSDRSSVIVDANWAHLWHRLNLPDPPPESHGLIELLASSGLVEIHAAARPGTEDYEVHPLVPAIVAAATPQTVSEAVDGQLADFWTAVVIAAVDGGDVGYAGRQAVAYAFRLGQWVRAQLIVEQVARRAPRPAGRAEAVAVMRAIAEHARGTDSELPTLGVLARLLADVDPVEAEQLLRRVETGAADAGLFRLAMITAGDLANLLKAGGRYQDALPVIGRKQIYVERAGLGPWTEFANYAQRLQLEQLLGDNERVLATVGGLVPDYFYHLPDPPTDDEAVVPSKVRESLCSTGAAAAEALGRWYDAFGYHDMIAASAQARGASELELATIRLNAARAQVRLGRTADARNALDGCRTVFEAHQAYRQVGRCLGVLAELEYQMEGRLGRGDQALRLQQAALRFFYLQPDPGDIAEAHRTLARYLAGWDNDGPASTAHLAAAAVVSYAAGRGIHPGDTEGLAAAVVAGNLPPADFAALCAQVDRVDGVHFAAVIDAWGGHGEELLSAVTRQVAAAFADAVETVLGRRWDVAVIRRTGVIDPADVSDLFRIAPEARERLSRLFGPKLGPERVPPRVPPSEAIEVEQIIDILLGPAPFRYRGGQEMFASRDPLGPNPWAGAGAGVWSDIDFGVPAASVPEPESEPHPYSPAHPAAVVSTGFASAPGGEGLPSDRTLAAGRRYQFFVEIGPELTADAIDTTATALPDLPAGTVLEVALFGLAGGLRPEPGADVGALRLLGDGSAVVETQPGVPVAGQRRLYLTVSTPDNPGIHRMRCNIYCRHALLQSRVVEAQVTDEERTVGGAALRSITDFAVVSDLRPEYVESLQLRTLSVLINDDGNGTHGFRFFGGADFKHDATLTGAVLTETLKKARNGLRLASWATDTEPTRSEFAQLRYRYSNPTRDVLVHDLIALARSGFIVWDALIEPLSAGNADELTDLMKPPGVIELANKESLDLLVPAACIYDYPLEVLAADLAVCPTFLAAQGSTPLAKTACFQGHCPSYGQRRVVCPSGFWGFRHQIGYSSSLTSGQSADARNQALVISGGPSPFFTIGVSTDPGLTQRDEHVKRLCKIVGNSWRIARSRTELFELFSTIVPSVVYLYGHGGNQGSVAFFEVGSADDGPIIRASLRGQADWRLSRPLVFLNGCHSAALAPDDAFSYATGFLQTAHASAVVGTEIAVFEKLAVAFAEDCLRRFVIERQPLGRAVLGTRLALLDQGVPLGLAYLAFGPSELRLAD